MARKRIHDNVHKLKGTYQKCRHGEPDEKLELVPRIPKKPAFVKGLAATEWRRVTRVLKEKGLITLLDQAVLAQYCVLYEKLAGDPSNLSAADHATSNHSAGTGLHAIVPRQDQH